MAPNASPLRPFHLAIPVDNLAQGRAFYGDVLGCREGRSSERWVDFDFWGHQLVIHECPRATDAAAHNPVDSQAVPVPHFGLVLTMEVWTQLRDRLIAADTKFCIEPQIRFAGQTGEQATMFLFDPAGNALEFKAMRDLDGLFAR